ncbi:MAG: PQQ-binding-like beta-propeller repeat protein, partial [Proteobacteria bacterium]|nr:PQQ-binding-like beta-propeller repeat protein [Pseudomonadota bacterium]
MKSRYRRSAIYRSIAAGLALALMLHTAATVRADGTASDWPGFRGTYGDGVSAGSPTLDRPGGIGLTVGWKKPLGSGYSALAVGDGHVVTAFSDGESDFVVAFAESDGRELWRHKIGETYKGHDGSHDGPISTPLIADGRVYALAPRGEFLALSLDSGKQVWSMHLVNDHQAKKPHYGFTTSPIFVDGAVVLQLGAPDAAVAGFDPATGKKLWATGKDGVGYQSPTL